LFHRFSTVFHRFRPFSGQSEAEIRSKNQALDRFSPAAQPLKTVKTA
jgi:hypothetical protein